jgi:hypothetical protein
MGIETIEIEIDGNRSLVRIEIECLDENDMSPKWMYRIHNGSFLTSNPPFTFSNREVALYSAYTELVKFYGDRVKKAKRSLTILNILDDQR